MFSGFGSLFSLTNSSVKNEEVNFINFSKNKNDCWSYYEGEFLNDKKNGIGSLYFNSKEKFIGGFCNDLIHGEG